MLPFKIIYSITTTHTTLFILKLFMPGLETQKMEPNNWLIS